MAAVISGIKDDLETFFTIKKPAEGEYKEKGSKFIGYAFPINTEKDTGHFLLQIKSLHPKARHYCYAWRLGLDNNSFRINDDGEPAGTAGKPIFGQLLSRQLTDVVVIVVRYFGGTLLGVPGLIYAYREAASQALEAAALVKLEPKMVFEIAALYEHLPSAQSLVKRSGAEILDSVYTAENCSLKIGVKMEDIPNFEALATQLFQLKVTNTGESVY